jgi:hypothetical protein
MKTLLVALLMGVLIQPVATFAAEGPMCSYYHPSVERKVKSIKSFGSDLSRMTLEKLYEDLKFDTRECLAECEGQKFKFCNEVAKAIEQKKPL